MLQFFCFNFSLIWWATITNRPFSLGLFVFSLRTMWYSLENCSFTDLKIIYSYAHNYSTFWKEGFSRVSSGALKWGNKPPGRKGYTILFTRTRLATMSKHLQKWFLFHIFYTHGKYAEVTGSWTKLHDICFYIFYTHGKRSLTLIQNFPRASHAYLLYAPIICDINGTVFSCSA